MSALTSLLVRDGVVPVRRIEDALQRQVISGGDVETILLEMDAVPENVLAAYRAALHGLAPATREEVMSVPPEIVRLVPAEVAFEHRLIPLVAEGPTLEVAVRDPLGADQADRLGFLLGYEIVCRIACEVRIAAGLAHHFGSELPPRFTRLLDRLRKRDSGEAPVLGAAVSRLGARASEIPYKTAAAEAGAHFEGTTRPIAPLADDPREPRARRNTSRGLGIVSEDPELAALAEREREARRTRSEPRREPVAGIPDEDDDEADRGPVVFPSSSREGEPPAPPPEPAPSIPAPRRTTSHGGLRLVRGPLTLAAGERLLKRAADRDQILEIFFSFARQFFDYTALFVVQDDAADGREAWGVGAPTDVIVGLEIPLDRPGVFAEARRSLAPQVRRLSGTETDRELASAMRRAGAPAALVMPVAIRQRVVLMLYGDRDGEDFDLGAVMELVRFGARVVEAFELLILRKKRAGVHAESEPPAAQSALEEAAMSTAETVGSARPDDERRRSESPAWRPGRRGHAELVPSQPSAADDDSWSTIVPDAAPDAEPPPSEPATEPPPSEPAAEPAPSEPDPRPTPSEPDPEPPSEPGAEPPPFERAPTEPAGLVPSHAPDAPPQAVLGIPRSAPPPPPSKELDLSAPELEALAATPEAQEEPELIVDAADEDGDDDLDDLEDLEPRRPPVSAPSRPRVEGTYRVHGGPVDVLRPGATSEATRRTSSRPRARPPRDPRREDDEDGAPAAEVVRAPSVRPPPRGLDAETRSVIVDMGEQVHAQVEDLLRETDEAKQNELIRGLLYLGEAALPTLVQAFPGPLAAGRGRSGPRPAGRDVSIIARALIAFGERAVPYVASLLGSGHADVRYYAALVASELVHPDLADAVSERVYDPDPDVRRLACALLPRFAGYRAFDEIRVITRRTARLRGKDPSRRWYAVDALASLRDVEVIDKLIELLKEDDSELVDHVHRALVILTCTDLGRSHRRWRAWHDKHGRGHRLEWLIEGLLHADEKIRALAGAELERLTQESYGYHAGSPKRDRERVHRRYRQWWTEEGQRRFA